MIGQNVQNYTITAYLGEGGMGTVYKASDTMLGRDVALKMLHGTLISQPQFLERFKKEARVLAQLLHPNIAVIYNFIGQDNNHFMVMEYVEGNNLDALLRKHKLLPHTIVVPVFLQVLEGLHHAHKKGIFHRDIKPSNLILTPDGTVKLMDFGIAKVAGEQRLTQVNRVVGTIEYMAPELIEGKDPSVSSDIYATGVTMYEMLTGKLPFEGNTDYTLMQDIMKKKPVSVDKLNSAVPPVLSNIIMKTLEKKPEQRYADAKAFQQALAMAFPQLREIDLTLAGKRATPVTQQAQAVSQPKIKLKPTTLQTTGNEGLTKPFSYIKTIQQKVFTRQKAPIVIGAFSILLALIILLPQFMTKKTVINPVDPSGQITDVNSADTLKDKTKEHSNYLPALNTDTTNNNNISVIPPDDASKNKNETTEESKEEKKKEEKKKDPATKDTKKTDNNKLVSKEENKESPRADKDVPAPEEKTEIIKSVEPERRTFQTMRINTRVEVDLYLRETINEATVREGQILYFTVTNPVSYNGQLIISKGASATGRVRNLTKKKISIVLSSVNSPSGQSLPFESIELSGRIEEIISSRNYAGTLKRGTMVNY